MPEGVMVALIGLIGSLIGSLIGVIASSKLTNYRLEQLEKRVQAHNNLIDRTYRCEQHNDLTDEKIKVINHRLEDLERFEHHINE